MDRKVTRRKVSRVNVDSFNGGLEFLLDCPPYDAELRDGIASVGPGLEKSIEILRRTFTDPEIERIFGQAYAAIRPGRFGRICDPVALPRPIRIPVTVATY